MGDMLETQFKRHSLHRRTRPQPFPGGDHAAFVQPRSRRAAQLAPKLALQLAKRQIAKPRQFTSAELRRFRQPFPSLPVDDFSSHGLHLDTLCYVSNSPDGRGFFQKYFRSVPERSEQDVFRP
jgi:hypothetical protein